MLQSSSPTELATQHLLAGTKQPVELKTKRFSPSTNQGMCEFEADHSHLSFTPISPPVLEASTWRLVEKDEWLRHVKSPVKAEFHRNPMQRYPLRPSIFPATCLHFVERTKHSHFPRGGEGSGAECLGGSGPALRVGAHGTSQAQRDISSRWPSTPQKYSAGGAPLMWEVT